MQSKIIYQCLRELNRVFRENEDLQIFMRSKIIYQPLEEFNRGLNQNEKSKLHSILNQ
jgi:hypothetical protein